MVLIAKATGKIWELSFVTRRLWLGVAIWRTATSGLQGWRVERRPGGCRVVTPVLGAGVCASLGAP